MSAPPQDRRGQEPPAEVRAADVTSTSAQPGARGLCPTTLGPVYVWPGQGAVPARTVENAWRCSHVYKGQVDGRGDPSAVHARWALAGWRSLAPARPPGTPPLYAVYRDARLGAEAARLYIYVPAYVEGLATSPAGRASYRALLAARAAGVLPLHGPAPAEEGGDRAGGLLAGRGHAPVLAALLADRLVAGRRRAAAACPEAAELAAGGLPPPPLPDFAPLRPSELHPPYAAAGAEIYFRPGFLGRLADRALAALLPGGEARIAWRQRQVNVFGWKDENRQTAFYGAPGTFYRYSGRDNAARPWADDPSGVLVMVRDLLEFATGERYNLCLMNLYEDRGRHIGKHADDERDLVPGSRIASVSLGAPRRFCLEGKTPGGTAAVPLPGAEFAVVHGCLLTMGGLTQRLLKHWVPPGKAEEGPRVNLTFRRVAPR